MHFEAVRIVDLRILREALLRFSPGLNLLLGPNAAGKTSVLEALSLLAQGRTFRRGGAGSLVRVGAAGLQLEGRALTAAGDTVAPRIRIDGRRMQAWCNAAAVRSRSELARRLPMVILGADAVALIEGGPAPRRRLIDWTGLLCHGDYLARLGAYRRALQQRNAALRRGDPALVAWEAPVARAGEALSQLRRWCVEAMNEALGQQGMWPWPGRLEIGYRAGWPAGLTLAEALAERRDADRRSGVTGVGPQRADVRVGVRDHGAKVPLSRGQMKFAALCAALAQAAAIEAAIGERPTLLVDDLAAELDERSTRAALALLARYPGQVVAAGLGRERVPGVAAKMFHVEHGDVSEMV